MIDISYNGFTESVKSIKDVPANVPRLAVLRMSQIAYDSAQQGAGRHVETGALFRSLYNRQGDTAIERRVGHDPSQTQSYNKMRGRSENYAVFVIFGAKPHVIKPADRKSLRWAGPNGFVFAGAVNHPGFIGDDYLEKARDDALSQFQRIIDTALQESIT